MTPGNVTVERNVIVQPNAGLIALFAGSDLTVGGNVIVQRTRRPAWAAGRRTGSASMTRRDEPTLSNNVSVGGNVIGSGALAVIIHNISVDGNIVLSGGGGGVNCDSQDILQGHRRTATSRTRRSAGTW